MSASVFDKNPLLFFQKLGSTENRRAALVSLLFTTLFFLPFFFDLFSAGFIYTGDIYHSWMPHIIKLSSTMRQGVFSAIDYSTHSGASELFLRSNMVTYHPLLIAASMLKNLSSPGLVSAFLTTAFYIHFFVGCFFGIKLMRDMFRFDFIIAAFAGVFYTFSLYMQRDIGFPPFVFIGTLFPAIIYAGYYSQQRQSLLVSFLCSLPIFVCFVSGYIAIAIAAAFFAALFLLLWFLIIQRPEKPLVTLYYAFLPFAIATFFAMPYYMAVFGNYIHTSAESAFSNVFASAHQLAENPRTVLRALSTGLVFKGPLYEQCLYIGIVPLSIIALAFANPWLFREEDEASRRSILLNGLGFVLFVLIMFGTYSVFSDMFHFLLPGIGKMHIYQRFLLFGNLFLGVFLGHLLQMFVRQTGTKPLAGRGKTVVFLFLALVVAAMFLNIEPDGSFSRTDNARITDYLVFDLLFASLVFAFWHFTNSIRLFIVLATLAVFIPAADHLYDFESSAGYDGGMQGTKHLEMNAAYIDSTGRFLGQDLGKAVVRVYNAEPGLTEAFASPNLPFFLVPRANVSDYLGYDFSLSESVEYRDVFPAFMNKQNLMEFKPNRDWFEYTGLDFILYKNSQLKDNPELASMIDSSNPVWTLRLTPDVTIAPTVWRMKKQKAGLVDPGIDNGYFRLESGDAQARMENFKTNKASYFKMDVTTAKPATLHYLFWKNKHLRFYVDGKRVQPGIKDNKFVSIQIPEGKHRITVCYLNILTSIFLGFYGVYVLGMLAAGLLYLRRRGREFRIFKWRITVPS